METNAGGGMIMRKTNRIALQDGPYGVDRWTSNGYGLRVNGMPVEPLDNLREIILLLICTRMIERTD